MAQWQTAIVTGAASGIGRAFAETLRRRGLRLGVIDVAGDALAQFAAADGGVQPQCADVGDTAQLTAAVDALVAALGGLDLVIHCAAVLGAGSFAQQPADAFERTIRIDLVGTANVIRATAAALGPRRGAIACLASTAAVHGWPGLAAYSAAKFGVAGLCDAVRPELARSGVSLTTVFPLLIDTPLLQGDIPRILRQGRRLPPQAVVDATLAAVARRRPRVFIPSSVRVIAALHGMAPSLLDWYGRRFGL